MAQSRVADEHRYDVLRCGLVDAARVGRDLLFTDDPFDVGLGLVYLFAHSRVPPNL